MGSLDQKMKLFGLVLISLTAAASPYHYRQPRDLANAANGGFGAGPGSNNKLSLTEVFEGKGAKKAKKEGKKDKKASKKAAKESGDSGEKKNMTTSPTMSNAKSQTKRRSKKSTKSTKKI